MLLQVIGYSTVQLTEVFSGKPVGESERNCNLFGFVSLILLPHVFY